MASIEEEDPDWSNPQDIKASHLQKLHETVQQKLTSLWTLFQDEYVLSLRERWKTTEYGDIPPSVGQIVIVHDFEKPKNLWRTATILELITNKTAKIQLLEGSKIITHRALRHLYPLEIK